MCYKTIDFASHDISGDHWMKVCLFKTGYDSKPVLQLQISFVIFLIMFFDLNQFNNLQLEKKQNMSESDKELVLYSVIH